MQEVRDVRAEYDGEALDHFYFHLRHNGSEEYRVVILHHLTYIPREAREQVTVLEKMRKVLRGVYNTGVNLVYLVAHVKDPPLGVVQCYGVQATSSWSREDALERARQGMAALQAGMAASFEQSRLEPITVELAEWLRRAFDKMRYPLVVIGHPDPRENPRGMDGIGVPGRGEAGMYSLQQNEMLFRGAVSLGKEFVDVVITRPVSPGDIFALQERVAQEASIWASKQRFNRSISLSLGLPVMLAGVLSRGTGLSYADSDAQSTVHTTGEARGVAHTEGMARGEARGTFESTAETRSWAVTRGNARSFSRGTGFTVSSGSTRAVADGTTYTTSRGTFSSHTVGGARSVAETSSWARTEGHGSSVTDTRGAEKTESLKLQSGGLFGVGGGYSLSESFSRAEAHSSFSSHTVGGAHTVTESSSWARASGQSQGVSHGTSHVVTRGNFQSTARGTFSGQSRGTFTSQTEGGSVTHARGTSLVESTVRSVADTTSHVKSTASSTGHTHAVSRGRSLIQGFNLGASVGLVPGISLGKTYQGEDRAAMLMTQVLTEFQRLLDEMGKEGGFLVDHYLLAPDEETRQALELLVPQAFHGTEDVVVPVRTRRLPPELEEELRLCTMTFATLDRPEAGPWALEAFRDSSLLTMLQASAYLTPGVFEEGTAVTVQEKIPPFAIVPDMQGEVVLGHFVSHETGMLTGIQVRLERRRMSNWGFFADTRFGKSVTAQRLVVEVVQQWRMRAFTLDFGFGWRLLLNFFPPGTCEYYGLYPGSPRPIRWNPLQIGRRILPERQLAATCELFVNAGRMGERQHGFMRRALRELYVENGVLTADREVWAHEVWGMVSKAEEAAVHAFLQAEGLPVRPIAGLHLPELTPDERQALAVHRSKAVDVTMWYGKLKEYHDRLSPRDVTNRTALEGVLLRMEPFTYGEMAAMYGRGEGAVAIEDLGLPYGAVILEGGEMDEYAKAVILGLMAWHLYTDAVVRRRRSIGKRQTVPPTLILFEEGNKIITGVVSSSQEQRPYQTAIFENMFRDAGKYHIYLGVISQSPSQLPGGIFSSCNCLVVGQLKGKEDRDLVLAAMGKSEKGFWYVDYSNFVERMPQAMAVLKLGLSQDVREVEPMLFRPLIVRAAEPSDEEIRERFT